MLVEASILARLLGLKILTLDASALVLPADAAPSALPPRTRRPSTTSSPRRRLGEALRRIDEGAALLAEARKNRSLL
jgi:pyridoxal biosynthesis lyase PdxS